MVSGCTGRAGGHYGFRGKIIHTKVCARFGQRPDTRKGFNFHSFYVPVPCATDECPVHSFGDMNEMLAAWRQQTAKLEAGEITKEEYDQWRYRYPEIDTSQCWTRVSSQELSGFIVDALNKEKQTIRIYKDED